MRPVEHFISFCNEINKVNNKKSTNDRYYLSYDIKITLKFHFWREKLFICHYARNVAMEVIVFPKICKPLLVNRFCCMALFHSQIERHLIN